MMIARLRRGLEFRVWVRAHVLTCKPLGLHLKAFRLVTAILHAVLHFTPKNRE